MIPPECSLRRKSSVPARPLSERRFQSYEREDKEPDNSKIAEIIGGITNCSRNERRH